MNTPQSLDEAIAAQIPSSLDDIIRLNRDRARLRLPTEAEVDSLRRVVEPGPARHTICPWWLVNYEFTRTDGTIVPRLLLVGRTEHGEAWVTSQIHAIDEAAGLVSTANSLYAVHGPRAVNEPCEPERIAICLALHAWGAGSALGVPRWFY